MIQRDGATTSLWQNMPPYQPVNKIQPSLQYDVAIVGGGITGLSTALLLQLAGKKCVLFEAESIGFGTTGGTTAHLNTLLDTPYDLIIKNFGVDNAALVHRAAHEAITLIKHNIDTFQIDCEFETAVAYTLAQDSDQEKELDKMFQACQQVKLDVKYVKSLDTPIPFTKGMRANDQAKFHPLKYVYGLAKAFEKEGGVIVQQCRVNEVEENDMIQIRTTQGQFEAAALIYATHIPTGINILHLRCAPWRSYAMACKLEASEKYPEELIYDMYDPYHYYRTQRIDGENYLIVGGKDHKTAHQENTNIPYTELESHVRQHFNVAAVTNRWSSQYYEPVDGLPYIGHLPGHSKNVYVATGFGGNGMTYSSVAALVLRGLIVYGESIYEHVFTPGRLKPVAGFSDFIGHNADVVKQFISKWFSTEELESLAGLAPGEGRVVEYEGKSMALSKDKTGTLHAVDPICTHMKCSVAWNLSEQSWDCPCHGARFNADGKVLNGPAAKNLDPIGIRNLVEKDS